MTDFDSSHTSDSDRLFIISQRVGFALWQLQELEDVLAQFLVLRTKAKRGMGSDAGNKLTEKARSKPFGISLREVADAGLFDSPLQAEFDTLLAERNWLVHRSRRDSRAAVRNDSAARSLIEKVDAIADNSLSLLCQVGSLTESYVAEHGIIKEYIDEQAANILTKRHDPNAA